MLDARKIPVHGVRPAAIRGLSMEELWVRHEIPPAKDEELVARHGAVPPDQESGKRAALEIMAAQENVRNGGADHDGHSGGERGSGEAAIIDPPEVAHGKHHKKHH